MRRRQALGAALCSVAVLGASSGCTSQPEISTLPQVSLARFEGPGQVDLAAVEGPAVVNLWASWCGPCRDELPVVEAFHQQYGDAVTVIGIDYQDPQVDQARALADRSGLTYDLLSDPSGALDASAPFPSLRGLPFWAFVDADGTVTDLEFVEMTSVDQLRAAVVEHLGLDLQGVAP